MMVHRDCRHFRGDIPCRPHKEHGVHCEGCGYYDKTGKKILIIKLGAIGDVIRTTPLLHKLKEVYPDAEITWLTHTPEVVPSVVDKIISFTLSNVIPLLAERFDIVYNLDKDMEACAIAVMIQADIKDGFTLKAGRCVPLNEKAEHKWLTGIFDDLNRENTKSYPAEIFEICGFEFNHERYIMDTPPQFRWDIKEKRPLVGLNTGCGSRWTTRLWDFEKWAALIDKLKKRGYGVLLLGGPNEDEKNRRLSEETGVSYLGHFPLNKFFSLLNQCDLIVTGVTMALHIAIGLGKKVVLFNNIFNRNEFELYDLGRIIEPAVECKGCFKQRFDSKCEVSNCMDLISPETVFKAVEELL
jgi:heptosyltransferase-2